MKEFVTVSRGQRLNLFQRIQHGNRSCPPLDLFHITDFTQVYFRIQMSRYYIFMSGVLRIQENEFMRLYLCLSTITLSPQVKQQVLKPMQTYREKCIHCMIPFIYHTKIVYKSMVSELKIVVSLGWEWGRVWEEPEAMAKLYYVLKVQILHLQKGI